MFRFTNKEKADFYLAEARLTFKEPETLGTISLDTTVRQLASHKLTLENPFSTSVMFQCQSSIPEIFFSPSPFELLPHASGEVEVAIRPTVAGGGEGSITLVSDELGTYRYAVKYSVAPADIEKVVGFKAPLGKEVSQAVRFLHYAKKPTTAYQASIELPPDSGKGVSGLKPNAILDNFSLESKTVTVASDTDNKGVEFQVNVKFTPSRLAESKATLVLKSPEGFEYKVSYQLMPGTMKMPRRCNLGVDPQDKCQPLGKRSRLLRRFMWWALFPIRWFLTTYKRRQPRRALVHQHCRSLAAVAVRHFLWAGLNLHRRRVHSDSGRGSQSILTSKIPSMFRRNFHSR